MSVYSGGLKSGINFELEPEWTYIWVGLYWNFKVLKNLMK